jgi:hypothetical protein
MTTSTKLTKSAVVSSESAPLAVSPKGAPVPGATVAPKGDVAGFCRAFIVHPATKDKSAKGIASRVARSLNATLGHTSNGGTYWTGVDVLALCEKEGITLGG